MLNKHDQTDMPRRWGQMQGEEKKVKQDQRQVGWKEKSGQKQEEKKMKQDQRQGKETSAGRPLLEPFFL